MSTIDDINGDTLPAPPALLTGEPIDLVFDSIKPGNAQYGFVPYYHFLMRTREHATAGHINFRVGMTDHVLFCAGHIGYAVEIPFRGKSLALYACRMLAPFIRSIYESVILTADPDNYPSIRTIRQLGATFLDRHPVPESDPNFKKGITEKLRYLWIV